MLANSFCTFLSFSALILVGFLLLHLEAVFTSAHFFLTANVYHGTLGLALCLVGMHSAAASKWTLIKIFIFVIRIMCVLTSPVVHRICFLVLTYIYL